jgi:predicted ribosomally synthesized peptide with nif11-like leader
MSVEQARALIKRLSEDEVFRQRVEDAPTPTDKRAILADAGYGDVKLRHISQALPESAGGELTDADLDLVAGGGSVNWGDVSVTTAASAMVAGAALAA